MVGDIDLWPSSPYCCLALAPATIAPIRSISVWLDPRELSPAGKQKVWQGGVAEDCVSLAGTGQMRSGNTEFGVAASAPTFLSPTISHFKDQKSIKTRGKSSRLL